MAMPIHSMIEGLKELEKERAKAAREREAQDKLREELSTVSAKDLAQMSDTELAAWQSKYPNPSPQANLAAFEWQRRLTSMQVKSTRFAAWLGLLGALLGVVLGALLTYGITKLLPH